MATSSNLARPDGHGLAWVRCSRQHAARGAWSTAGHRGGASFLPGDNDGWIPSVQPCLGGSRWDDGQPSYSAVASPACFLSAVCPKATPCSVSNGVGVDGRVG
jgi:hypothetical protein